MQQPYVKPSAAQIVRWLESNAIGHNVRHSRARGDIYLIDNPGVPGDSGYHVGISPDQGWVRDFRPHYTEYNGSFLRFVSKVRNCSFQAAIKEVCGQDANLKVLLDDARRRLKKKDVEPEPVVVYDDTISMPPGMLPITDKSRPKAWEIAAGYLHKRAITLEEAAKFNVHYDAARICFPYIEYGELVYWQVREIFNKRYEFPEATEQRSAENYLHGFDFVEPGMDIIIVEAIFNEVVLGEGALASGGAALKQRQYRRIRDVLEPARVILAPDNDDAGRASLSANYELLKQAFKDRLYYCIPPNPYKDWNDMAQALDRLNHLNIVRDYINANLKPLNIATINRLRIKL